MVYLQLLRDISMHMTKINKKYKKKHETNLKRGENKNKYERKKNINFIYTAYQGSSIIRRHGKWKKKPGKYDDGKKMTTTVTTNEDERIERIAKVAGNTGKRNISIWKI